MPKLLRSFLFVPADRPDRIEKAAAMQTDVVVVELEDGVAPERKAMARNHAGRMLAQLDFNGDVAVRVNRISTLNGVADILALAEWPHKPDMLMIPKVESAGEIQIYDSLLTEIDAQCELIPLVESSRGLQAMTSIVTASSRISAIAFGGADLSAELECLFAWEPLLIHRATLVAAGALAGIPLIDAPFLEIRDNPGLANEKSLPPVLSGIAVRRRQEAGRGRERSSTVSPVKGEPAISRTSRLSSSRPSTMCSTGVPRWIRR